MRCRSLEEVEVACGGLAGGRGLKNRSPRSRASATCGPASRVPWIRRPTLYIVRLDAWNLIDDSRANQLRYQLDAVATFLADDSLTFSENFMADGRTS